VLSVGLTISDPILTVVPTETKLIEMAPVGEDCKVTAPCIYLTIVGAGVIYANLNTGLFSNGFI